MPRTGKDPEKVYIMPGASAPGPHQRNFCYKDPMTARNELFTSVTDPQTVDSRETLLKFLENEENLRAQHVHGYEKQKLSAHIASIEETQARNKQLAAMSGTIKKYLPDIDPVHANGGHSATTMQKQDAMTDILVAALASELTNVVTFTVDMLGTPVSGLPGNEKDHMRTHAIGHDASYSGVPGDVIRENMRIRHIKLVTTIAERLKAIPETDGKGTMFDNTVILYFPENGETHHSVGTEAPFVVLAGDNCGLDMFGRYIRLPYHGNEGHKTLSNWWTTLLNAHGNPIEHYGDFDLTMSRLKLDQAGAIKRFL